MQNQKLPPPEQWEQLFAAQKVMARPLVGAFNRLCRYAEVSELDDGEKNALENAAAAYLFQKTQELTAEGLLMLTLAGLVAPRVPEYAAKRAEKRKNAQAIDGTIVTRTEAQPA